MPREAIITLALRSAVTAASIVAPARTADRPTSLPTLTGLRFLAALLVVLYHADKYWRPGLIPTGAPSGRLLDALVLGDYTGVNLFFVLSGFILAYTYLDADGGLRGTPAAFYLARIARVYPLYLVALALGLVPLLCGRFTIAAPLVTVPATLTLTETWLPHPDIAWAMAGWSLAAEAFFYLLFPLLARPLAGLLRRALVAVLAACWLTTIVCAVVAPGGPRGAVGEPHAWVFLMWPPARLPEFIFGVALGRLFVSRRSGVPRWVVAAGALTSVAALVTSGLSPTLITSTGTFDAAFGVLIYALACRPSGALAMPMLVRLGEASYALYLLHQPLWLIAVVALGWTNGVPLTPLAHAEIGVAILFMVGLSIVAYRRIEMPARRAIRAFGRPGGCVWDIGRKTERI